MFDLIEFSDEFSTEYILKNNTFNDLVMVDGLIVPLLSIPEDLQELVRKERSEGIDVEIITKRE